MKPERIQPTDDDYELAPEIQELSLIFLLSRAAELCARAVRSHQGLRRHPVKSALLRHANRVLRSLRMTLLAAEINLVVDDPDESPSATRPDDAE